MRPQLRHAEQVPKTPMILRISDLRGSGFAASRDDAGEGPSPPAAAKANHLSVANSAADSGKRRRKYQRPSGKSENISQYSDGRPAGKSRRGAPNVLRDHR